MYWNEMGSSFNAPTYNGGIWNTPYEIGGGGGSGGGYSPMNQSFYGGGGGWITGPTQMPGQLQQSQVPSPYTSLPSSSTSMAYDNQHMTPVAAPSQDPYNGGGLAQLMQGDYSGPASRSLWDGWTPRQGGMYRFGG